MLEHSMHTTCTCERCINLQSCDIRRLDQLLHPDLFCLIYFALILLLFRAVLVMARLPGSLPFVLLLLFALALIAFASPNIRIYAKSQV